MSFPEEPLDLPPTEGGGYYPATISEQLNKRKYHIVRKLGYGPQSSTWLAFEKLWRGRKYFAIKIFTIAASKRVQIPILNNITDLDPTLRLPYFHESFWERSDDGWYLCVVMKPMSTSVRVLQLDAENQRLPVHAVRRIVSIVSDALEGLHDAGIMHGAVKAENMLFLTPIKTDDLQPILDSEPSPVVTRIRQYSTVRSQPLTHSFKWNDKLKRVVDWPIYLDNLGHAQQLNYMPEMNNDYCSAPETLLGNSSCSPQTDIWMLGYMTFELLTGSQPFYLNKKFSKTIAVMRAVLLDEVPEKWLSDSKMKEYNDTAHGTVTIEASLADALHEDDVFPAAAFIKACLRLDPKKRLTSTEASKHDWLTVKNPCSCEFC